LRLGDLLIQAREKTHATADGDLPKRLQDFVQARLGDKRRCDGDDGSAPELTLQRIPEIVRPAVFNNVPLHAVRLPCTEKVYSWVHLYILMSHRDQVKQELNLFRCIIGRVLPGLGTFKIPFNLTWDILG
jgi:hypothetical protein